MIGESHAGLRRVAPATILAALALVTVLVVILAPEPVQQGRGDPTSRSTGAGGVRMFYELAQRMGWHASERLVPFHSTNANSANTPRSVQVVLQARGAVGEREVHDLLENVRAGGGLLFDVEGNGEIADSLGIELRASRYGVTTGEYPPCPAAGSIGERAQLAFAPPVREIRWRRPAPGPVTRIGPGAAIRSAHGVAFPMGAGRVVAIASSDVLTNEAVRRCEWGDDVVAARALEFLRPHTSGPAVLVFDEYHHGYGMSEGSLDAITGYLSSVASGRFLAQAMLAGLILLFAKVARPTLPRDEAHIPRRSPLEHADALAHAYVDVAATKTGTLRLVDGLRRRAGRVVPVSVRAENDAFLAAIVERVPSLSRPVATVTNALAMTVSPREFLDVGAAIREIERQLLTSPMRKS
jgi:hypothetical protein